MPQYLRGGQRTTQGNQLPPFIMCALGIEPRPFDKYLHRPTHLTGQEIMILDSRENVPFHSIFSVLCFYLKESHQ